LITPLGHSVAETAEAWTRGDVAGVERHRTRAGTPVRLAAVSREGVSVSLRTPKLEKYLSWPTTLAVGAAVSAWRAAGRTVPEPAGDRAGVYAAVGTSALECDEFLPACAAAWTGPDPGDYAAVGGRPLRLIEPHFALRTLANGPAAFVSMELGLRGPSTVFVQSRSASVLALQAACDDLALRRVDIAVVVACDSLLEPSTLVAMERAGLLDRPSVPSLGEGAAALVLSRDDGESRRAGTIVEVESFCGESASDALRSWFASRGLCGPGARAIRTWSTLSTGLMGPTVRPLLQSPNRDVTDLEGRFGDLGAGAPLACVALSLNLGTMGTELVSVEEAPDRLGAILLEA
jgi:3-oxoacyl-(acyl-carrier-protein) synthase